MNYLEYEVLKNRKEAFSEEEKEQCLQLLGALIKLSMVRRRSGVLALEEHAHENDLEKESQTAEFYKDAVLHVVDGNDPKSVELYLSNDLVFYGTETFQGYLCYLIMKGILSIQSGDSRNTTQEKLLHCLPFSVREEGRERMEKTAAEYQEKVPEFRKPEPEVRKPKPVKNPFLSKAVFKLARIDDERLEQFVRQAKPDEMMMLQEYISAELREKMLGYVPEPVKEMLDKEGRSFSPEEISKLSCAVMSALKK